MQPAKPPIVEIMQKLNPTSVLDLGCGKCNFSKKFIDKGVDVLGIDKEVTAESHDNFKFIQKNILDFKFKSKYDLIIGSCILHFLKGDEARELVKKMQKNTVSGGFHFLVCMSNEDALDNEIYFYPNKEELNKLYFGWDISHNISCLSKKHGKDIHQHKMIIFLAKKKYVRFPSQNY